MNGNTEPTVRNLNDDPHNQEIAIETSHDNRRDALTTFLYQAEGVTGYTGGLMPRHSYTVGLDATENNAPAPLGSVINNLKTIADALGYEVRFSCHKWESTGTAYFRPLPDGEWINDMSETLSHSEATSRDNKPDPKASA